MTVIKQQKSLLFKRALKSVVWFALRMHGRNKNKFAYINQYKTYTYTGNAHRLQCI